jgi:hypothetical protein
VRRGIVQLDSAEEHEGANMWSWADRMVKAVSDVTVGTVIVLVHVALADRNRRWPQPDAPPQRRIAN